MRPGKPFSQNLFPIALSQNGLSDTEKRDWWELVKRPVLGCPADPPNGRE